MLDRTDRHFRFLLRLLSHRVELYTEMVVCDALLSRNGNRIVDFDPREKPLILQLAGSDPGKLGRCAELAEARGYDGINLNVGCPSDRVQRGRFGACLMKTPELVAECVSAMQARTRLPVSVKCRIGVDELDRYQDLARFVAIVAEGGCRIFIIHARKAWLKGLSAKENRVVPPLRYDYVYRLKRDFPQYTVILNGGIADLEQARLQLQWVDGVMIGRAVYQNPYLLAHADAWFYQDAHPIPSREQVLAAYVPYVAAQLQQGVRWSLVARHLMGLYHGQPVARKWRRYLTEASGVAALESWLAQAPFARP
ncbi:tRNA dihydrouridine(20/20a) synthase DusA [Methylothermus subterraneus]